MQCHWPCEEAREQRDRSETSRRMPDTEPLTHGLLEVVAHKCAVLARCYRVASANGHFLCKLSEAAFASPAHLNMFAEPREPVGDDRRRLRIGCHVCQSFVKVCVRLLIHYAKRCAPAHMPFQATSRCTVASHNNIKRINDVPHTSI